MAKFYLTSGSMKLVVHADDAHKAALWAMHRTAQQVLPGEEQYFSADGKLAEVTELDMLHWKLGDEFHISERGFDSTEFIVKTEEIALEYFELMIALTKLEEVIAQAEFVDD